MPADEEPRRAQTESARRSSQPYSATVQKAPATRLVATERLERLADFVRQRFDRWSRPGIGLTGIIAVLAGLTIWTGYKLSASLAAGCDALAVLPMRLEVTFDPGRFAALLRSSGGDNCQANLTRHFLGWDMPFALAYAVTLTALYIWVERWSRFDVSGAPSEEPLPRWSRFFVLAPLFAGMLDILPENLLLYRAAAAVPLGSLPVNMHDISSTIGWAVVLGSAASTIKWILLVLVGLGIVRELLRGPRGVVIRRTRYSILAVAVGALTLVIIPQGQDILQRLVEGAHPPTRVFASIVGLFFGALTIWYCARKIVELRFEGDERWKGDAWFAYFAEKIPRIFGVTFLGLCGAAFARAALVLPAFAAASVIGLLVVLTMRSKPSDPPAVERSFGAQALLAIGRVVTVLKPSWRRMDLFTERIGMALVANIIAGIPLAWCAWSLRGDSTPQLAIEACYLQLGAWLCSCAAWVFYLFVAFRRPRIVMRAAMASASRKRDAGAPAIESTGSTQSALTPTGHRNELYLTARADAISRQLKLGVLAAAGASLIFLALFTFVPVDVGRFLGPLWVLVIAVANAVAVGTVTVWLFYRYRVPVVTIAILLAVVFSAWNDNHAVRPLAVRATNVVDPRPALAAHLDQWLHVRGLSAASGKPDPVILVAAAGGGLRAAYWTATVLAAAQDRDSAFVRHVFAISGVSGGSLGAAVFTALAHDMATSGGALLPCMGGPERGKAATPPPGAMSSCTRTLLSDDFLSPVLAKLVAPDLAQRFLPIGVRAFDRSSGLEGSWENSYNTKVGRPTFANGLVSLTRDSASRLSLPALFLNSTHVETGRRYIAMNLRPDAAVGPTLGDADSTFADAVDVIGLLTGDLRLSGAVHNSARFTFVSPPGRLDKGDGVEYGHVVDGGYFENSGLATLHEIDHLVRLRSLRPIVVYLCNDPASCARDMTSDRSQVVRASTTNELLGPVRAVMRARDARGSMARAQMKEEAGDDFLQFSVCDELNVGETTGGAPAVASESERATRSRERVVSPPLGWLLSRMARDWMDSSLLAGQKPSVRTSPCVAHNAAVLERLHSLLTR